MNSWFTFGLVIAIIYFIISTIKMFNIKYLEFILSKVEDYSITYEITKPIYDIKKGYDNDNTILKITIYILHITFIHFLIAICLWLLSFIIVFILLIVGIAYFINKKINKN